VGRLGTARAYNALIPSGYAMLQGELIIPAGAKGVVLFAHGSGSSRHSPRNQLVASKIRDAGIGTLLFDLLTQEEEAVDIRINHLRFDLDLLATRLLDATNWIKEREETSSLRIGYFGSSTGAGAALIASVEMKDNISAIVSRGGRPDLAKSSLPLVTSPTHLIVGEYDRTVIDLNRSTYKELQCKKELTIIEGASHLFEELGKIEEVADIAANWFSQFLNR
jgi:putative phosphoribosyl transferase